MTWNFQSNGTEDDEADLVVCALSRESLQHEEWAKKQNNGPIQFRPFFSEVRNCITESFIALICHVLSSFFWKL
jgi:hypothetical protein